MRDDLSAIMPASKSFIRSAETLTIATRHAQAQSIVLALDYAINGVKLAVSDDGIGIDEALRNRQRTCRT